MSNLVHESQAPSSTSTTQISPSSLSSLLLSHRPLGRKVIIVGTGKLALSRVNACLEAGAKCVVVAVEPNCIDSILSSSSSSSNDIASTSTSTDKARRIKCVDSELERKCHRGIESGEIEWFNGAELGLLPNKKLSKDAEEGPSIQSSWNSFLDRIDGKSEETDSTLEPQLFAVCVTDTLHLAISDDSISDPISTHSSSSNSSNQASSRAHLLSKLCRSRRIPINVADRPNLCDFSFPATHRFQTIKTSTSPSFPSSLQIAVTTNGKGCRLASRIRREIISNLPRNVGDAVEKVGEMREMAKIGDKRRRLSIASTNGDADGDRVNGIKKVGKTTKSEDVIEDDLNFDTTPLNSPVPQLSSNRDVGDQLDKAGQALAREQRRRTSNLKQETSKASISENGVISRDEDEDAEDTKRRMRWVAQISEYWPIEYLGSLTKEQMKDTLGTYKNEDKIKNLEDPKAKSLSNGTGERRSSMRSVSHSPTRGRDISARDQLVTDLPSSIKARRASSQHALDIGPPSTSLDSSKGNIYLLGAGTGHPGLLTVLAHRILTSSSTDLILSDKLVPASILRLIPSTTPLVIAKKFPGNAEGAQSELIALALKASKEGKNVVRLKQGDPFVYGRGGEEVLAFRNAGIEPTVVPGISSSLAAPLMLGIPVTQRGCSDSLLLCTGVGRGGKIVKLPGYERNRTSVLLMGVARLEAVVKALTEDQGGKTNNRSGEAFPNYIPIAIIERASSTDQRLIASTLDGIVKAMESSGEQRPPGMIVIGWSVLALEGKGGMDVSDDEMKCFQEAREESKEGESEDDIEKKSKSKLEERDRKRVENWVKANGNDKGYIMKEGLDHVYSQSLNELTSFNQVESLENDELSISKSSLENRSPNEVHASSSGTSTPKLSNSNSPFDLNSRSETGWSEARYRSNPTGGWIEGEGQNIPAINQLEYEQHMEYVRAAEAANKSGKKMVEP